MNAIPHKIEIKSNVGDGLFFKTYPIVHFLSHLFFLVGQLSIHEGDSFEYLRD